MEGRQPSSQRGERQRKGRKKSSVLGSQKKNTSSKTLGNQEEWTIVSFINSGAQILRFWKFVLFSRLELGGQQYSWGKEWWRPGSGQQGVGISWVAMGENIPLPGIHLERVYYLSKDKRPSTIEWLFISKGQKSKQRAENLVAAFHCTWSETPGTCVAMWIFSGTKQHQT